MAAELSPHLRAYPMSPNQVLAGPTSGTTASPPAGRTLVAADLTTATVAAANTIFAGPATGASVAATFRAQVYADQAVATPKVDIYNALWHGAL